MVEWEMHLRKEIASIESVALVRAVTLIVRPGLKETIALSGCGLFFPGVTEG